MKWEELRKELQSITDDQKKHHDLVAQMVEDIIARRIALGLTQKQVADRACVKQPAIARMESGGAVPRMDTLIRVAEALGMQVVLIPRGQNDEQAVALAR